MNKLLSNTLSSSVAAVILFVASATAVRAELVVYEGFGYPAIGDAGGGGALTNGFGWAEGSFWTRENSKDILSITASSLSYGSVAATSNKLELSGSNGRYSNRSFAATIDSSVSDTIWGGVLMKTPSSKTGRTSRFKLRSGGTDQFYVIADSAATIIVGGGSATAIDTGVSSGTSTRFYLFRIDLGGTEPVAALWISPGDFSSEIALGAPSVTITDIGGTYTGFSLGASGGNPAPYDEVRIGTTLKDAWQTLPPVAPRGTIVLVR